jgi:nucleotide-binding universal stress UspA family protein
MFRDLLVHVEGNEARRDCARLATDLARRTDARLTGLHIRPPAAVSPHYKPSQVEAALARSAARLAANARVAKRIFEDEVRALSDARWFEGEGDVADGIVLRARFADLVILEHDEWQDPLEVHVLPVAHTVVLRCGRPVLVVPVGVASSVFPKVAVAWDGSREAVRAVHDALPLLKMAQTVHLVAVIEPSDTTIDADVNDLVAHLTHHGVSIEAKVECAQNYDEHRALQRNIDEGSYDLVVMGGYSHPRWMEFIFGGSTIMALLSSNIPVFISH